MLDIQIIPALADNYIYLCHNRDTGRRFVVDPGEAAPVKRALAARGWGLDAILITHHHHDHVGGLEELIAAYPCPVFGSQVDGAAIAAIDHTTKDGDTIDVCGAPARVMATPGHTLGHISYWFAESGTLFCGDTLFSLGCGRLFEGTAHQMWDSLCRLGDLPGDTHIYCGHEYSVAHARFALTIEPNNARLQERTAAIARLRGKNQPTVPTTLSQEHVCNPFLRAATPEVKAALNMVGAANVDVFAELRRRKDHFR